MRLLDPKWVFRFDLNHVTLTGTGVVLGVRQGTAHLSPAPCVMLRSFLSNANKVERLAQQYFINTLFLVLLTPPPTRTLWPALHQAQATGIPNTAPEPTYGPDPPGCPPLPPPPTSPALAYVHTQALASDASSAPSPACSASRRSSWHRTQHWPSTNRCWTLGPPTAPPTAAPSQVTLLTQHPAQLPPKPAPWAGPRHLTTTLAPAAASLAAATPALAGRTSMRCL
jgi:hypothetical protein